MNSQSLSQRICDFVLSLQYEDIPSGVIDHVKLLITDTLGCAVASMGEPHEACIGKAIEKLPNTRDVTLWGTDKKVGMDHAVMYNGALIHGLDYDDTHAGAIVHPSASVLNTAFAYGELLGLGGRELLTAMVASYEVLLRLGEACKGMLHETYFHPTGLFAPFAAICLAGRLTGVDKDTLVNAIGLAGNFVGPTQQYTVDGTWSKKLHPGWGVHAGLYALRFAEEGYIASPEIFEGAQGMFEAHIGTTEFLEPTFSDFGKRWMTSEVAFKFYPACHMMHSCFDILLSLMGEHAFAAGDIESIHAVLSPRAAHIVGLPPESKLRPENDYLMRFSIQYCLAMTALGGRLANADVNMRHLKDPAVLDLIDRVSVEGDPGADVVGHFPGDLAVTLKDGRSFRRAQRYETGSLEKPAKSEDVLRKYFGNMDGALPKATAERLVSLIDRFEELDNIGEIIRLLKK